MDGLTNIETAPPTILLADDDRVTRQILTAYLSQSGEYQVIEVDDGDACLKRYASVKPDIILLDASMPLLDGFECCRRLRSLDPPVSIPILMITGLDDSASVDRAFEVGATDYVTKPIHWPVLRQRVRLYIERHHFHLDLQQANQMLLKMAALDSLTRIANRRSFDHKLQQEWQRLARASAPLALALFDVDFFKAYNDSQGHLAGDSCLQKIAAAAQQTVQRPADLVARYGGEEFALLLPETGEAGAVSIAQQLCRAVREQAICHGASPVGPWVSISIGVASLVPKDMMSPDRLIEAADAALYCAKDQGRDRVVAHSQLTASNCLST